MQEEIINIGETAELLGISKGTVRNWIKHGYLKAVDPKGRYFPTFEVLKLNKAIAAGKINRLKKRANKVRADKNFIPTEYLKNAENGLKISHLIQYIKQYGIDKEMAILVLALNLFRLKGDLMITDLPKLLDFPPDAFLRKSVYSELKDFFIGIFENEKGRGKGVGYSDALEFIYNYHLPPERDVLGVVYQALINEGKKASLGSYFTPTEIVDGMVRENVNLGQKVLDPCCGTGKFLLAFADCLEESNDIYGIDSDLTSVRIARINLLLRFSGDFCPKVFHRNTLCLVDGGKVIPSFSGGFDFVATNPPWGAAISKNNLEKLSIEFPDITSGESFSYFLRVSLGFLKEGGSLSFVLPESFLNIRTHSDIRKFILKNFKIKRIECLGKKFRNVLSSVIRLDLSNKKPDGEEKVLVRRPGEEYNIAQKRFLENKWYVFDVYLQEQDERILRKVSQTEHTTLEGNADWALGIVTGDNQKFLQSRPEEGYEPIYKGSDINSFSLKNNSSYIKFSPKTFQQVAPEEKYRAKEKLIYKFISRTPVFAYDDQARLTLNSANILIPRESYPLKVILALFNSSLYRFLYMKKFNSIKILRGDLEQLPLPLWEKEVFDRIIEMVDWVLQGEKEIAVTLDSYLMEQFGISPSDREYINSYTNQRR